MSTEPPSDGCPLCGSTWGDWWQEVQGERRFFCCSLCADQWMTMLDRVRTSTGWPRVDRIEVEGNRWGRTCEAHHGDASFRFFVSFTPEGALKRFDALEPLAEPTEEAAEEAVVATPSIDDADDIGATSEAPPAEAPEAEVPETTLHPALVEQLRHEADAFPPLTQVPVEEARQAVRQMVRETDELAGGAPAVAMLKTSSYARGDHRVPVRVYLPTSGEAPYPVVVYFHGGGWVFGDLDTHDSVCREIANRSSCAVVSVGYRRSPEHKYPEALEDAYGAVLWVADPATATRLQIDPERIGVAGDSVGGNLAAVVCLLARERRGPRISAQVLICPVTAHAPDTPSYREFATGFGLEAAFMPWMWAQYFRTPDDAGDPHVAPLRAPDLSGLPPALVVTAAVDVLRDEGEEYGERLRAAGGVATVSRYARMPHGFLDYRGLVDEGWDALDEIGAMLERTLRAIPETQ